MPLKKSEIYSTLWEACNKLRGGVEPARYKDYVLVLLFFKYVSDKYTSNDPFARFQVAPDSSFDELVKAKGKKDIGERVNKIIQKFLKDNGLSDSLPEVNFDNHDELGSGKELVDKLSGLIGTFQNLDFSSNRASGDDIIGDAYEYFMMKFAQESGKSKGQFYTPSEVSRVIARLIGIENVNSTRMKLYDPCAGSGSLLIRAADESPVDKDGQPLVTIYAQEKDNSTAGLAKMNFILHTKGNGEIKKGNTLSDPKFVDSFRQLERFDFIVMNPPFSDKSWSDGVNTQSDIFHRFDGFGVPPAKNGDYAWLLHVVKSLTNNGKAGIVMPHGVLFRGNAEEFIRVNLLKTRYIKGVVSLPQNLFFGTGIPACLIFIDKENAENREHIFFIDASDGFRKDGNKNRLREQDIEKIVRVYKAQQEIPGYSRLVSYSEILDKNGGNMNVPRYIQKPDESLQQSIEAHLHGGIPKHDIDSLAKIWRISPELMSKIFDVSGNEIYRLVLDADGIEKVFEADKALLAQKSHEAIEIFAAWKKEARVKLLNITEDISPKILISELVFVMDKDAEEIAGPELRQILLRITALQKADGYVEHVVAAENAVVSASAVHVNADPHMVDSGHLHGMVDMVEIDLQIRLLERGRLEVPDGIDLDDAAVCLKGPELIVGQAAVMVEKGLAAGVGADYRCLAVLYAVPESSARSMGTVHEDSAAVHLADDLLPEGSKPLCGIRRVGGGVADKVVVRVAEGNVSDPHVRIAADIPDIVPYPETVLDADEKRLLPELFRFKRL